MVFLHFLLPFQRPRQRRMAHRKLSIIFLSWRPIRSCTILLNRTYFQSRFHPAFLRRHLISCGSLLRTWQQPAPPPRIPPVPVVLISCRHPMCHKDLPRPRVQTLNPTARTHRQSRTVNIVIRLLRFHLRRLVSNSRNSLINLNPITVLDSTIYRTPFNTSRMEVILSSSSSSSSDNHKHRTLSSHTIDRKHVTRAVISAILPLPVPNSIHPIRITRITAIEVDLLYASSKVDAPDCIETRLDGYRLDYRPQQSTPTNPHQQRQMRSNSNSKSKVRNHS